MKTHRLTTFAQVWIRSSGFGLLEVLLALGVITVMAAAVWWVFGPTSVAAQVKETQLDFSQTATSIERSMGILGGYSGLTTAMVRADGLAPQRLRRNGTLTNTWGGSVMVTASTVKWGNDAFLLETRNVPKSACAKLVAAMAADPSVWDAQVNGQSVFVDNTYDPATAAAACKAHGGDRMGFVYFSGLAAGSSVAAPPLALPSVPPRVAPPASEPEGGPVGPVGPVGPATPVSPIAPAPPITNPAPPSASPPSITPVTPTAPPADPPVRPAPPPIPSVPPCTVPPTQTQNLNCPAGQIGTVTQQRVGYCGEVGGPYEAWSTATYGPWTTVSNTCAPACVLPSPSNETNVETRTVSQTLGCPAGHTGSIVQTRQEQRSQARFAYCPAPTGSPSWSGWSGWSDWTPITGWATTSNTCVSSKSYAWKLVKHEGDILNGGMMCTSASYTYNGATVPGSSIPSCSAAVEGQTYLYRLTRAACPPVFMPGVSIDTYQCVGQ